MKGRVGASQQTALGHAQSSLRQASVLVLILRR